MATATVDTVLDKLCRYHVVIFIFAFIRGMPVTWNLMMPVFGASSAIEFRCNDDVLKDTVATASGGDHPLWTNNTDQCFSSAGTNASKPCESWVYDRSVYGKTATEEWNMVCSNRFMVSTSQSIYLAGMVVGTVAASQASDWFGRKKTILVGIVTSAGATAMTALSTSATMYYVSRFLVALAAAGYSDVIYSLIMETLSPRFRYVPIVTMDNGWTTGMLLLPWLHYLTKEWRTTQLYTVVTFAPVLLLGCFLPESPRWLMAVGKFSEAKQVVTKFARNAPTHVVDNIIEEAKRKKASVRGTGRASVADLFSTMVWAKRTTLFSLQLITYSLIWYHVTVSTATVGGNPYVNFTIGASSEYPVRLVNALLIKYCRRRLAVCGSMCFSALVMIAILFVRVEYSWVRLGLLMVGKVGSSAIGGVVRVQLSETYPTVVRSVALGFCQTLGWLGSALAPFFVDLGEATQPWVPNVAAAGLCLAGAAASLMVPESFEKTLEDGFSKGEAAVNEAPVARCSGPQEVYVIETTRF